MYSKALRRFEILRSRFVKLLTIRSISAEVGEDNVLRSSLPDIEIPNLTIPQFLFQRWSSYSNRIALECAVSGKKYTFEELRKKSINLSVSFQKKLNLQKGDVVAISLPNTPDYAVCILGALQAGLVVTTLTPLYSAEEIARHLSETEAKIIITITPLLPLVQKSGSKVKLITLKSNLADPLPAGTISFNELIDDCQDDTSVPVDANDVALMPSSSGTTGFPKAVELTHRNVIVNVCQLSNLDAREIFRGREDYQAVTPGCLPFFHVAGLMPTLFTALHNMSQLITLPKFDAEVYTRILENYKPDYLITVPYIVGFLTNNPIIKKKHLEKVRLIASSAAPLSAFDEERLLNKAGEQAEVIQAYGMTEATALITLSGIENTKFPKGFGSVGKPLQNTRVKVVDETGKALGPNTTGELLITGPQIMKGYHNKPKETQETFVDEWLKTGDIGYYNENNMIYVTDRIKELIKVKGFQVAPAELEAVIRDHPYVLEAAVIGIPHSAYGEVPRAYVVLKDNKNMKSEEIQRFVSNKVANYKQLQGGVAFVKNLPKASSGKIMRKQLKMEYEEKSHKDGETELFN